MAKRRWLLFFQVAREVTEEMVPPYRSKGSKHVFTQPQLLAILCLMRYEGWTFREIEEWLWKQRRILRMLALKRVPDHSTLCRFQQRIEENFLNRALSQIIYRLTFREKLHGSSFSGDHLLRFNGEGSSHPDLRDSVGERLEEGASMTEAEESQKGIGSPGKA